MSNSSTWSIDWTLPDAITWGQSGHEIDGNEGVLRITKAPELREFYHQTV